MKTAKVKGTRSGNPIGRPRRVFDREEVLSLRRQGLSIAKIARRMGLGAGTVVRVIQAPADDATAFQNPMEGFRNDGRGELAAE